jgi:RNA polymerase sigma-70 factor, ECF subfamily
MSDRAPAARAAGEEGLVERARRGEDAALDALVAGHYRAVYGVTYRVLGDEELAADAAQDTFIKAIGALGSFRGESSVRTWLLRIATNTARSVGRRRTSRREVSLEPELERRASGPDPASRAVTRTEAERAARALQELPEKQRLAVSLRIYEDLSHREIAEVLGSSEGAVRVNYHLGIKRLRELLA